MRLHCKDATHLIEVAKEKELNFKDNFTLLLHTMTCHSCKEYAKHSSVIDHHIGLFFKNLVKFKLLKLSEEFKRNLILKLQLNS